MVKSWNRWHSAAKKKARPWPRRKKYVPSLCGCRGWHRLDIDTSAAFVEFDFAINESEQSPIATRADVVTGGKFRSTLPHQDAAGGDKFTTISFYAQPFAD